MRRLLACLALFAVAASPVRSSTGRDGPVTLSADSEQRWVPFDITPGNQVRFRIEVDGRPVTAVLDTGVSYSVLARSYVDRQKIAVVASGTATAIGGSVPIGWVRTRTITLGGLTRSGGRLAVTALPAIATGGAGSVDMLVGRDLIGSVALDIDYQGKRLRLLRSGRMPFTGFAAPLIVDRDRLIYTGELTLGSRTLRPMVIDTGDGSAVTVSAEGWRDAGLAGLRSTTAIAYGLAGPISSTLAIVPQLRIGQLVARSVEVRVEPAGGFSEAIGAAGRIGTGFLQNYRVLMDPGAGRIVFSPGPGADRPPLRSTSGLLLGVAPDRLLVVHVMKNGPAEAAGWKANDAICSIDGTPIPADYATSPLAAWSIGAPGRRVALGMCDGTRRVLTLASFY